MKSFGGNYLVLIGSCSVIKRPGGSANESMIDEGLVYPAYPIQPLKISGRGENRILMEREEVE